MDPETAAEPALEQPRNESPVDSVDAGGETPATTASGRDVGTPVRATAPDTPSPWSTGNTTVKRITLNLTAEDVANIEEIARTTGTSAADVVRRSLRTERYVVRARESGKQLSVTEGDKTTVVELLH